MNNEKSAGLYIHIPFCKSKCRYCDFYSLSGHEDCFGSYEKRVSDALDYYRERYARRYNSLYFGGGTPLYFGEGHLSSIIKHASTLLDEGSEITVEGNPERGESVDFGALRECGVNRLSFGLQSSDERELKTLGRIHTAGDAAVSVRRAKEAGIDNISLDLMIGIPYQTEESLLESIRFCSELGARHVSAYMLKIEDGTPLSRDPELVSLCASDEKAADLYLLAAEELEKTGYRQYEISNFAQPGYESRHNLKYWHDEEYLGIGPGAHSFMDGRRFYFGRNLDAFLSKPFGETEEYESEGGTWDEYAMLALRLREGLDTEKLGALYPSCDAASVMRRAEQFKGTGLVETEGNIIRMTTKGFLVSNALTAELLFG